MADTYGKSGVKFELDDPRDPDRTRHPFVELLRTWVLLLVHGWTDQNDVALLRHDPVLRLAVSTRRGDSPLRPSEGPAPDELCSQSTLSRLLYVLAGEENEAGLARIVRQVVAPFLGPARQEVTLDLDSFPHVVHGHQPGTAYNAHYHARCFHPLVAGIDGRFFLGGRLLAANILAADADLLSRDDKVRMSRERFRVLLLKTAARVLLSGRRVTVVIEAARARLWQSFRAALLDPPPARDSPLLQALPVQP